MNGLAATPTLLVVDDQPAIRTTLEFVLGISGFAVLSADSGLAAVALAEEKTVHGVLIDIHMTGMGGFETCSRLRELPSFQATNPKIWFMTGAANQTIEKRGVEMGSRGLFTKPFNHVELVARIQRDLAET